MNYEYYTFLLSSPARFETIRFESIPAVQGGAIRVENQIRATEGTNASLLVGTIAYYLFSDRRIIC